MLVVFGNSTTKLDEKILKQLEVSVDILIFFMSNEVIKVSYKE